jgi:hypothetical protein
LVSDIPQAGSQGTSNRVLKAVVIGLAILIVIALGALVVGIVLKFNGHGAPSIAATPGLRYRVPAGAKVVEMQTVPGRLILHVRTPAGDEVDIIDTADGHLISQVKAAK